MTTREYITELTGYEWGVRNRIKNFFKEFVELVVFYVLYLIGTAILMLMTLAFWITDETSWLHVLEFLLIMPIILVLLTYYGMEIKEIRIVRLLETFLGFTTNDSKMKAADKYLYDLLNAGKILERNYPRFRKARNACFKNEKIISERVPYYCQMLYDIDREFAEKHEFRDSHIRKPSAKTSASHTNQRSTPEYTRKLIYSKKCPAAAMYVSVPKEPFGTCNDNSITSNSFYMPPSGNSEDDDSIALDMEEAIDDDIMFHGGNPFDWDTRSDYLDDPFGFGGDDGDGGEDW